MMTSRALPPILGVLCLSGTIAALPAAPEENVQAATLTFPDETLDTWHGFKRHHFTVAGCQAWVVEPKQALPGNPWSWCMEFPDAFTERCAAPALLEKGFYHAYLSVGNTFGCPTAVKQLLAFYDVLTAKGLAKKPVLIGLSRGGLYAYRFASENPEKVGVIYGDAPVCDFKSWPGGKGKGQGSAGDWAALLKCYGFNDEAEALAYRGNPIDVLEPLAKARIPLIHVVGDADDTVPFAENTALLEERYRKLGGEIQVIHKPGIGHHPHGLEDPSPVVEFIVKHTPGAADAASAQHAEIGVAAPAAGQDADAPADSRWFHEAGLGLFIHWGLASLAGNLDLSWGMIKDTPWDAGQKNRNKLAPSKYFALAKEFNPTSYHPERWLKAAKDAGFGYAVLTTRHHEGFALWPSAYGDFSTRNSLGGRDLVREYVDACRKVGLKVGFYYSPPDWHYEREYRSWGYGTKGTPESPHLGLDHQPVAALPKRPADYEERYVAYVNGQLTELLTRYGRIDYLWFDGSAGPKVLSREQIRKLQPGILINDRQHGKGDVVTGPYECRLPEQRPNALWEHCFSMVGAWGYTKPERSSPASLLLAHLAKVRAWGGNVLANYGPRPDGEMPDCFYERMAEMKAWMAHSGASLVGVEGGPYPEKCSVPVTVHGKSWFAHLLPKTPEGPAAEGKIVLTGAGRPQRVTLLATGTELPAQSDGDRVTIEVPQALRSELDDVVRIEWK